MSEITRSLCHEPHPELDGVLCDKKTHAYGPHSCREHGKDWEGIPIPVKTKSAKAKMAEVINRASPEQRTGPPTGTMLKDRGMRQALDASPEAWKDAFKAEASRLARLGEPFTSEDVLASVGLPNGEVIRDGNNAVGAMMGALSRKGVIAKTGRHLVSQRAVSHGAELTEWVGAPQNSLTV